jgi:hypothetical protein
MVKRLQQLGFAGPLEGGEVSVDLLQRILRRAGISREDWLAGE